MDLPLSFVCRIIPLMTELALHNIPAVNQVHLPVQYKGCNVGEYYADTIVDNCVVLELKAQQKLSREHETQLLNYMKAGSFKIGLLVNFTYPKAEISRFVT